MSPASTALFVGIKVGSNFMFPSFQPPPPSCSLSLQPVSPSFIPLFPFNSIHIFHSFHLFFFAHLCLPSWIIIILYSRMNSAPAAMYNTTNQQCYCPPNPCVGLIAPRGMHPLPIPCDLPPMSSPFFPFLLNSSNHHCPIPVKGLYDVLPFGQILLSFSQFPFQPQFSLNHPQLAPSIRAHNSILFETNSIAIRLVPPIKISFTFHPFSYLLLNPPSLVQ